MDIIFFDYEIYRELIDNFTLRYHPMLIRLILFKYNKKWELKYITREEFNKEFYKVNEEIKEKVFLIWDIAEYFGLYVKKEASTIVGVNNNIAGDPTIIQFWFGFSLTKNNKLLDFEEEVKKFKVMTDEELNEKEKGVWKEEKKEVELQSELIKKVDREIMKKKKEEIKKLFKNKGENFIKEQSWYCEKVLKVIMKESQYYEVGRIGMIMKQLKWMMGKKFGMLQRVWRMRKREKNL